MIPIDAETADVIDRLRRSKEGQIFSSYLQKAFRDVQGRLLEDSDEVRLRTFQGEARVLKVLTEKWSSTSNSLTGSDR